MIRFSDPRIVALSRDDAFVLRDGTGQSLDVLDGEVWITREGDSRDHVLSAGQRFDIPGPGVVVATPLSDSAVLVRNGASQPVAERRPRAVIAVPA